MRIADDECEELRRRYLEHEGVELSLDEAREMLLRLSVLVERFAAWVVREQAAGRSFETDSPPPKP